MANFNVCNFFFCHKISKDSLLYKGVTSNLFSIYKLIGIYTPYIQLRKKLRPIAIPTDRLQTEHPNHQQYP